MLRPIHITISLLASLALPLTGPGVCSGQCEQDKLIADDDDAGDKFGGAVSIDGDYAAIGAVYDDGGGSNAGAAYIFFRSDNSWSQQDKLVADDIQAGDQFGCSVAIDGDTGVVGAQLADHSEKTGCGAAYVFTRDGTDWSQQQKLIASDADDGDFFGGSVAIDGNYIVVGAWGENSAGNQSGAAYVFYWNGSSWNQQAKLTASDADVGDRFAYSVSIDGDFIAIGAPLYNGGAGYPYGVAYIFTRDGTDWDEQDQFTGDDVTAGNKFGHSVSLSGDTLLVGAYAQNWTTGAAYTFERDQQGNWGQEQKLTPSDGASADAFGSSVALSGDLAVIGAYGDDDDGSNSGSAYVFERSERAPWSQVAKLTASDAAAGDRFGLSVWIAGGDICVGAPYDDDGGSESGSAYVFLFEAPCVGDLDGDCDTDQADLDILLNDWGCTSDCVGDLDGDDDTDQSDLGILLNDWLCGT